MFFGLPLRVTIVTTEPNGMPLCSFWFQFVVDLAGLDEAGDVGLDARS